MAKNKAAAQAEGSASPRIIARFTLVPEPDKPDAKAKSAWVRQMISENGVPTGRLYIPRLVVPSLDAECEMVLVPKGTRL